MGYYEFSEHKLPIPGNGSLENKPYSNTKAQISIISQLFIICSPSDSRKVSHYMNILISSESTIIFYDWILVVIWKRINMIASRIKRVICFKNNDKEYLKSLQNKAQYA